MADKKSCQTKPIASTADYLSRKATVGSTLPITARDLGGKYNFTFDPLTDERRTTYNDVYLDECLIALLQYLYGQQITPGSGGDTPPVNPPAPVAPPLTAVRIYGPKSIYVGDYAVAVARTTGGSPQVTFDWDAGGKAITGLVKGNSIIGARFQEPGPITLTVTATDGDVTQTATAELDVQALPTVPVPADEIEIDGINLYTSSPVIVGKPAFFAATARQGTNIQWAWDFGDGSPAASNQIDAHAFQTVGNYTVKLTAMNAKGEKSYTDSDGQEGYKIEVIADPDVIIYDMDIDSENIRVPMPDPIYTGVNYDFGAFLMDKVVENPQWGWSFNPVKDDGTPAQSGDQIGPRYWGSGQIEDNKWSDDQVGNHTIWIRLVYGPKNARRTVYSSEIVTVKSLPKAGPTPTPTPTGPTYDTAIEPQDITVPIPENLYVGVEYQLAAFLETKRVENPSWWFTFDPKDNNGQPLADGSQIDRRAWQGGPVEDMLFKDGQDGPHWVWVKLEHGPSDQRQTVYEKFAISVSKLPGNNQGPTILPLSANDMRFIVLPQSSPYGANQVDDQKAAPTIHAGETAMMWVDTGNRVFPPGTLYSFSMFTKTREFDVNFPYAVLPYPRADATPAPAANDTATVTIEQPGVPVITLTRPIIFDPTPISSGAPLALSDMAFYAYPPELAVHDVTELVLSNEPFPVTIGTRVPLVLRTKNNKTFPTGTSFQFYTDIQYGNWRSTTPTMSVPVYICDLTGADGDTTKPITSKPGPVKAYVSVRQPGAAPITVPLVLDLKAASAPPTPTPTPTPDTAPVNPWEINIKAQGLRGGITELDRLEPGATYYLMPEITGRNVRGRFTMLITLESALSTDVADKNNQECFVWLDGDPKDGKPYHLFAWGDRTTDDTKLGDFNPRNPQQDDVMANSLPINNEVRQPGDRMLYIVVFRAQDENGKDVGDPIARGFYAQAITLDYIVTGLPSEPDKSAAIVLSGQQQSYLVNTPYTFTAGLARGYATDDNHSFRWILGQPFDSAPKSDMGAWLAADSNGRFVVNWDSNIIADPNDPSRKNMNFKLWVMLVIHHADGKDTQVTSQTFTMLVNPG